jgi:glutathione synthase/RimK-type ligase-like ATP-grasp enzyme
MRVGIFGTDDDPQVHAVAREVRALGADDVLIRSDAFQAGLPLSNLDGRWVYRGADLTDLEGFYLRSVPAPYAPAFERESDGELVLYEDWFTRYMQERERAAWFVSWLLSLQARGVRLVNPPHAASVLQYKPFQLHVLRELGAAVPRTLISNDPVAVRAFEREVGEVIFKPVMGGAVTRALAEVDDDELATVQESPVIFQERVHGDDVRVMLAGDEVVSAVAIRTPSQHLDFRADPVYSDGDATYEEVVLPEGVVEHCRRAARACGLLFAGLDLKRTADGRWVFLELNSSPIYLDVELKNGHAISAAIAKLVVGRSGANTVPRP